MTVKEYVQFQKEEFKTVEKWKEFHFKTLEDEMLEVDNDYLKELNDCESWNEVERFASKWII